MIPRKSWSLVPPTTNVRADLLRHYWRGHFDGDGWLSAPSAKAKRRVWQLGLVGTAAVATAFAEFVQRECGVRVRVGPEKRTGATWAAGIRGVHQLKAVVGLLYGGATVSLERKRIKAARLTEETPRLPPFQPYDPLTLNGETLTVPEWSDRLGIGVTTIYYRLHRGATPEQALKPVGSLTHLGETLTLCEWSRRSGVKRTTIRERLKRGCTPEEALRPVSR